ncbi:MAG: type I DNA topoisomerase [Actinobacteria bacterium]|nr:type I DNA topoisomerase [Actinomycetota bacterium]
MATSSKKTAPDGLRRLVIVESPAKAKTIEKYLGAGYVVDASVGHIRDLPKKAADIPEKYKKEPWARLGVDVDHDFAPIYVVDANKKKKVAELKALLKEADELLLATDEDREGEAIAWHLLQVLNPKIPVRRMVFNEITPEAIQRAATETREIDQDLVDAQETRRILDRLYGYEVSPVLWRKVMSRLSAGRVQSVATRLVVDRERERIAFTSARYFDIEGVFDPGAFTARLVTVDAAKVATGRDFDQSGQLKNADVVVLDEATVNALVSGLTGSTFAVRSVDDKPYRRSPSAPFMTSTLQQEASRKQRWGAQRTMRVAQGLYERGFITYMRTDSTTLSQTALDAARSQARELYGSEYVSEVPRRFDKKSKNAQEAHEAIRPAGDVFKTPAEVAGELTGDDFALYELIWKRTVASQMTDAIGRTATLRLGAKSADGKDVEFSASGTVITFRGFMAAYEEAADDEKTETDDAERRLPPLSVGDSVTASALIPQDHSTNPPARYTEASLVKALEERGIGRPSTYASIMGTILDRGYVNKRGSALVPTFLAFAVTRLLEDHFAHLVDYNFTASMEDGLDEIASGNADMKQWLSRFYFGGDDLVGLKTLTGDLGEIDARDNSTFAVGDPGLGINLRVGKFGPYLERETEGELQRANVPADMAPDELTVEKAEELFAIPSGEREMGVHPEWGVSIVAKSGRYGAYVTEVLPEGSPKTLKPRTASLFASMHLDTVTLEDALRLLSLPRVVGVDPSDEQEIMVQNGRYGPYLKKGTDSRTIASEDLIFAITLDEALAIYAQPKQRGRRAAAPPMRDLGIDPSTSKPVVIKEGRFGPYITDGETNATVPSSADPMTLSVDRAFDLLAAKRAAGPAPKKTAAKKSTAKKATRKTPKPPKSTTARTVKKKSARKS